VTQPSFVPIIEADQVRPAYRLRVPHIWTQSRPSEVRSTTQPRGRRMGSPGPDIGYALKLARHLEDEVELQPGEHLHDAMAGITAVAMRRAAGFGRAPVLADLRTAATLWGYLPDAPADLVSFRVPVFRSASHLYGVQRAICDRVRPATYRLTPEAVAERLGAWRSLLVADEPAGAPDEPAVAVG
jgi:hypothetical protein